MHLIPTLKGKTLSLRAGLFFTICMVAGTPLFEEVSAQRSNYIKNFTTDHGISHNSISSIAQDSTGFLWFGTWDGACRYDGYEFRNFFHDPEDSSSIPNFSIVSVKADKHNNVWIFPAFNLLAVYNRASNNFSTLNLQSDSVLQQTGIETISTAIDGDLWIGGAGGIACYNYGNKRFDKVIAFDKSSRDPVNIHPEQISVDNLDHVWITTTKEYICCNLLRKSKSTAVQILQRFARFNFEKLNLPNGFRISHEFCFDSQNRPWLVSNIGCRQLSETRLIFNVIDYAEPVLDSKVRKSIIWYMFRNRIVVILPDGTRDEIRLSAGEYPSAVYMDKDESIWYSTLTLTGISSGLYRYDRTPGYFEHYLTKSNGKQSVVYSINMNNRNEIMIGVQGNSFLALIAKDGEVKKINPLNALQAAQSKHIRSLTTDGNGMYLGYMKSRLDYYDYKTEKTHNICLTDDTTYFLEPYGFRSMYVDGKNDIIVGAIGLFHFDLRNKVFTNLWDNKSLRKSIFCIKKDDKGRIWAASSSRLIRLTKDYRVDTVYTLSRTDYNIEDICFGDSGTIWLALLGGGLEFFNPDNGKIEFYTTADGLSNNTTYSILKDRRGQLWISTDNGISRFDPRTKKFRIFGYTDGLAIHEFNSDAAFVAPDGRFFFGGMGGVVGFYPDSIYDAEHPLNDHLLILHNFTVSGFKRNFPVAVYEAESITLRKGDDNFSITFALIDFRNADKIKYRYRLQGYSDQWIETDHMHRSISFAGLKPDKYILQVECTDVSGNWQKRKDLAIIIPPFFYQTLWFSIFVFLLAATIVSFFALLNYRQIRIREKQKQNHLKLQSIRGQLNPHFVFNSLNSINYFIANSDRLSANRYISNFSKLIRSFLNNMSHEYISLSDEIDSLQDYLRLEFLRFGDKFNYSLNFDQVKEIERWEVFPGMVQPFIENAIWHGVRGLHDRKGNITITFGRNHNDDLKCEVCDDGIGRIASAKMRLSEGERKSMGIQLIRERLHIINHLNKKNYQVVISDLFTDRAECGTKVIIDIPAIFK